LSTVTVFLARMGGSRRPCCLWLAGLSETVITTTRCLVEVTKMNTQNLRTEVLHWDGRLDNRDDLLPRLKDSLRSDTSNQAIAAAVYERWGTNGLVQLIGDWSLVLRDRVNHTTVLASDFAGVRPLYYCVQAGRVLWSSRLESLVEATR